MEHLDSAHDDGELEALKFAARQRLAPTQGELNLRMLTFGHPVQPGPLTGSDAATQPPRRPSRSSIDQTLCTNLIKVGTDIHRQGCFQVAFPV